MSVITYKLNDDPIRDFVEINSATINATRLKVLAKLQEHGVPTCPLAGGEHARAIYVNPPVRQMVTTTSKLPPLRAIDRSASERKAAWSGAAVAAALNSAITACIGQQSVVTNGQQIS